MSACFLWVSHQPTHAPIHDEALAQALSAWVPFEEEGVMRYAHPSQRATLFAWATHQEGARGAYVAQSEGGREALAFTGWWREPEGAPLSMSSAEVALRACLGQREGQKGAQGYERGLADFAPLGGWSTTENSWGEGDELSEALDALHLSPGQFAFGLADREGQVHGVNSAFCGVPLCYAEGVIEVCGERAQVTLISNRASLISAALEGGTPAQPRAEVLAWLLARSEHPIGDDELPFPGVSRLHGGQRVCAFEGSLKVLDVEQPHAEPYNTDALYASFLWRTSALKRYPDVPLSMALTGGFDSRLVLAGLLATGQEGRVERFYINAHPDHADTRSAQAIANAFGLELNVDPPGRGQDPHEPFLERLRRHNLLTEYLCSAWDIVSGPPSRELPERGLLPGHYGELYRGHSLGRLSRTWWLLRPTYRVMMNRHRLLTPQRSARCASIAGAWLREERLSGTRADLALDRLHRYARMEGWISQCHPIEALGFPSFALLSCVSTRAHYEAQAQAERERPSVHYALTRRAHDELWRVPFANTPWPPALYEGEEVSPPPALKGGGRELGYQMRMWREQGDELSAWLLSSLPSSELWRVISQPRLKAKLKRMRERPHPQGVKSLMCACAIKLALDEPLRPVKLRRA